MRRFPMGTVFLVGNGIDLLVMVPLVLTSVTGLSTLQLGPFLIPGGAAISIVAALSGRVTTVGGGCRWGCRRPPGRPGTAGSAGSPRDRPCASWLGQGP